MEFKSYQNEASKTIQKNATDIRLTEIVPLFRNYRRNWLSSYST